MCQANTNDGTMMESNHFVDAFSTIFLPSEVPTMPLEEATKGSKTDRDCVLNCLKDFLEKSELERKIGSGEEIAILCDVASRFVQLHLGHNPFSPDCVFKSLVKTNVGGYWAYHIRAQNAAILIYRKTEDEAEFMAWQVQSPNPVVTNNVFIHQTYPQVTVWVSWERLLDSVPMLCDLATREQPLAVPTSRKAGEDFDETREVNNPFFVLDVLTSSFGGEVPPRDGYVTLDKKLQDVVRYKSSARPWRREPVYSVLKHALHLICFRETKSSLDYKILMQRFLIYCLDSATSSSSSSIHHSVSAVTHSSLIEASRKLVRRGEKLRQELSVKPFILTALDSELKLVAEKVLKPVNERWKSKCSKRNSADFDVPLSSMEKATVHSLPNSGAVLEQLSRITSNNGDISAGADSQQSGDIGRPKEFERLRVWSPYRVNDIKKQTELLHAAITTRFRVAPQDFIRTIHDVSEGIIDAFREPVACTDTQTDGVAVALLQLEKRLIDVGLGLGEYEALSPFEGDVRARSEVILVAFTICLIIDKIACRKYPLLAQHKLGVPTTGIFDHLFLPTVKYRKHLSHIEAYLAHRAAATGPPSLESSRSSQSFAVQFARQCPAMEEVRAKIMSECRKLQESKRHEKRDKQKQYNELMRRVAQSSCSCYYNGYRTVTCRRCEDESQAKNIYVTFYEKYLPPTLFGQQAVVFELQIPDVLACQRDSLVAFAVSVCDEEWQSEADFRGYWREESNLGRWKNPVSSSEMMLGSTRKKVTQSHYRQGRVNAHHDFVVDHGYELRAMGPNGAMVGISSWRWNISSHATMAVPEGPYHSLQGYFNSYSHSENSILASKSEASEQLSLQEFEEVGLLRAGVSLQLERMLAGLQQQLFSLDRKEIVSLFCCALWQVGPRSTGEYFRDSCELLRLQPEFAIRMCRILDRVLDECKMNWSNQNIILCILHVGRHLLEHSRACEHREGQVECVKILRECRSVAGIWIRRLLAKLNECTDDDARLLYREKIVDVACMGTISFLDYEDLLCNTSDVHHWSFFRAVLHDNYAPNEILKPSQRRPLLLYCMKVAEQVAPRLLQTLEADEGKEGLSMFLNEYWTGSTTGKLLSGWARYDGSSRWFFATFQTRDGAQRTLQLDVVGGSFLVDGCACARLPKEICAHDVYRRLFDNALFLVQPIRRGAYRTTFPINGFYFEFYSSSFNQSLGFRDNPVIIKERAGEPVDKDKPENAEQVDTDKAVLVQRLVLVPVALLNGDFPEILERDYSHWYAIQSNHDVTKCNNMYFRPVKYSDWRMALGVEKDDYALHYCEKRLVEQTSGHHFVDIHSGPFNELYESVFERLSPSKFVHVKVATRAKEVLVDLPRLSHMTFVYDGESIQTRQFGGLQVAKDQNCGVLIGMKHGLLLEDPNRLTDSVILCPHGAVSRHGDDTFIDTEILYNPPFFRYNLRSELHDLKPAGEGRLGWIFLACLHAHTGDLLPDPFTGCTGTKRAMDILRLGCCKGNLVTSMDPAIILEHMKPELQLLGNIANVSLQRQDYHNTGMEQVVFGSHPALCAHEGLAHLAHQRLNNLAEALKAVGKENLIHNECKQVLQHSFAGRTELLAERAYFQRRKHYPRDACLTEEEEALLSVALESVPSNASASHFGPAELKDIQCVSYSAQNHESFFFNQPSLSDLLGNRKKLAGCNHKINHSDENVVVNLDILLESRCRGSEMDTEEDNNKGHYNRKTPFHHIWLHLYQMAVSESYATRQGQNLFGFFLTFVAAHYPEMHKYLHQLVLIGEHQDQFPPPPQHGSYTKTNEVDFVQHHVDALIDDHLEKFLTAEPSCPRYANSHQRQQYERHLQQWQNNKSAHLAVNKKTKADLLEFCLRIFNSGGYVGIDNVRKSHVIKCPELVFALSQLFDRWRHSKELQAFRETVTQKLNSLQEQMRLASEPCALFRVPTGQWPRRPSFHLATNSWAEVSVSENHMRILSSSAVSGRYVEAYKYVPPALSSPTQTSPFVFTRPSIHHSEADLCQHLATSLEASVKDALQSPEQLYQFLEDPETRSHIELGLQSYKQRAQEMMQCCWDLITRARQCSSCLLPLVGLWDSTAHWNVLAHHFKSINLNALRTDLQEPFAMNAANHITNAFAVSMKHLQRARRCLALLRKGEAAFSRLAHDIESQGCTGWTPDKYPEFLAFEIDNDVCIRKEQALVAKEILRNDLGKRLLQLNMGCGKSAVIMPLALCVAADGDSIARGTVLSSLYSTNASDWQNKVGGLLGRQIFPMMCCREMPLSAQQAHKMRKQLDYIRGGRHFIVTVPEHRLSLENKALEACNKEDYELGHSLLDVLRELDAKGRNFVDESDEIASPKYQLVYPLGSPQEMDAAQMRWLIHAAVLQSVSRHAEDMFARYGAETVEVVGMQSSHHQYSAIRLLDGPAMNAAYKYLCNRILDDILEDRNGLKLRLQLHEKDIWRQCALGGDAQHLESLSSEKLMHSALCLRGILSHEVLLLVLQKRFRVDYGSHPCRPHYQMAVPYRAKDVAAERTDFAHPDVCLGLTFATYYQSGLSQEQLFDVFKRLARMNDASAIYSRWTEGVDEIGNLSSYTAINLDDMVLFKDHIFPTFRKHLGVIDFWLLKVIFPAQAKQFAWKISSNAVDLFKSTKLSPHCKGVSTGFAGTCDLSPVLPPTVQQINLDELAKTNGVQILNIMRPENNTYYSLAAQESSANSAATSKLSTPQILDYLSSSESQTNVVLDPGALVLEMSNEKFARAWLKQRTDCDACAFFKGDRIVYVSRNDDSKVMPFSGSQFEVCMSKCLLYLDDEHTRGSDFKLPLNARALLTLGKGMNKDKFVQACMRMRQLGKGQQLCFVASHDVHLELERIPDEGGSEISQLSRIVNWTLQNTSKRICDLVPYFVSQAISSMRKYAAFQQHYYKGGSKPVAEKIDLLNLAKACTEKEELTLREMYLHPRGKKMLLDLATDRLQVHKLQKSELGREVLDRVREKTAPCAIRHCSLHDEEQEVEREQELDEERQVERPPPAEALDSFVSPELENYFKKGSSRIGVNTRAAAVQHFKRLGFQPLSLYFGETGFTNDIDDKLGEAIVFVTSDFIRSVKGNEDKTFYLKRFRWIVQPSLEGLKVAFLISNFEAEHFFLSQLRTGHLQIESFVPKINRGQLNLSRTAPESLPAELHVFGGSINAEAAVLSSMKSYLGLHPSDTTKWNKLYERHEIGLDGFVPPSKRSVDQLAAYCPFQESPTQFLVRFLVDARHLGSDIRTSALGEMIEICEEDAQTTYRVEE